MRRLYNTKFCFQCNKLKFQLADYPGLFNRKPKTENGIKIRTKGPEGESLKVRNTQIRGENYLLGEICAIIIIGSRRLGV